MAKTSIKVKCDSVQSNANNSVARFVVELPPLPPAKPSEAPQRVAKTIIQMQFSDSDSATKFKVNGEYSITIEG